MPVNGRMQHYCRASIISIDLSSDIARVGNELVDTSRRGDVPSLQSLSKERHADASDDSRTTFGCIVVVLIPHIAHGRMNVTKMFRSGRRLYALCHTMAGAQDEIIRRKTESLNSKRE